MKELCKAAQELGRMARGVPKKYSEEELKKRTERILQVNEKRRKDRDRQSTQTQTNEDAGAST